MILKKICQQVKEAASTERLLRIQGGNSKRFLGRDLSDLPCVDITRLAGVVQYEPAELVIQVRAGTLLQDVINLLDSEGQMFAFDPPVFNGRATIGGMVASGISGSRRPYAGAVRDFVLGACVINGVGEPLRFGGQVLKNVAGYDVSRLMVGSMGCLGILTEVSFKVLPKPESEVTRAIDLSADRAHKMMRELSSRPSLVSATAYFEGRLHVRFSGAEQSVIKATSAFGGESIEPAFWFALDNLEIFKQGTELWRVSLTPDSELFLSECRVFDWAGGQRWLSDPEFDPREKMGIDAHATLLKSATTDDRYTPLTGVSLTLHQGLKRQFDPHQILNPNKMYSDF
ncbi:MAG TPA: glycolate oxidase subunit GlcE [Pseudomonadales bacterium]|nr:glycolate oxidase subunit GlcE [Pseudomonadales bacterium]MDP6315833.1 glycolate oxidase subunit GlcE [Pseudomonadales bacterium]MDP7314190.1 glycolate oxidase subunit GlcE [Pseudomonadales bacterium]HJP51314.1 glycolate oxidase subunit GlcE [Pseudomonadales bacterium]